MQIAGSVKGITLEAKRWGKGNGLWLRVASGTENALDIHLFSHTLLVIYSPCIQQT